LKYICSTRYQNIKRNPNPISSNKLLVPPRSIGVDADLTTGTYVWPPLLPEIITTVLPGGGGGGGGGGLQIEGDISKSASLSDISFC
jgi:hypothetical protein